MPIADRLPWRLPRGAHGPENESKVRALFVFEAAIFAYLAGTAAAQVDIVYFRN